MNSKKSQILFIAVLYNFFRGLSIKKVKDMEINLCKMLNLTYEQANITAALDIIQEGEKNRQLQPAFSKEFVQADPALRSVRSFNFFIKKVLMQQIILQ
jgi:hypothetical protein